VFGFQFPVFRKSPACLAHQPGRRTVNDTAMAGIEKSLAVRHFRPK
jgi:hypothetical protein